MKQILKFGCWVLLLVVGIHFAFSGVQATLTSARYTNRLMNLRHLDDHWEQQQALLKAFFRSSVNPGTTGRVGVFGSSFSYGYPFSPVLAYPHQLQESYPRSRIFNISVIGQDLSGIRQNLETGNDCGTQFETVIIECPIFNTLLYITPPAEGQLPAPSPPNPISTEARLLPRKRVPSLSVKTFTTVPLDGLLAMRPRTDGPRRDRVPDPASYLEWFVGLPWGLHHFSVFWDEYAYVRQERTFTLAQVPEGYFCNKQQFDSKKEMYRQELLQTLEAAKRVSKKVYIFPSPVHLSAIAKLGYDPDAVRDQFEFTTRVCNSVPGVTCLQIDERFLQNREFFFNLTHLNLKGHQAFADWLRGKMAETDR